MIVNFKISMEEETAQRSATDICYAYNYSPIVLNPFTNEQEQNPETAQEFAFRQMVGYIKNIMIYHETKHLSTSDKLAKIAEIQALSITMEVLE